MYNVREFVRWALTHTKDGAEPWQYLFGSVRVQTTQATLDYYYDHHYAKQMTRARYDKITADWDRNGYATDCQGLLDAWLTYEKGDKTDINANMNFDAWCTERGRIDELTRPWVLGEAVFRMNAEGRMTHVGWVCGVEPVMKEPLIVEARGIAYGVVVTRLSERDFTHRGLMTKKFDYNGGYTPMTIFEVTKPMQTGESYAKMQDALNAAGYRDADGNALEVDGKWGKRSQQAFDAMIADYAPDVVPTPAPQPEPEPIAAWNDVNGRRIVLEYR